MGGTCSTHGRIRKWYKIVLGNLSGPLLRLNIRVCGIEMG